MRNAAIHRVKRERNVTKGGTVSIETKQLRTEKEVGKAVPRPSPYPTLPSLPKESRLVSFGERITYTFAYGKDVGSIHFDRARHEIFYKGHNIRHMELETWQEQMLEKFRQVLRDNEKGRPFSEAYSHTLDKVILEKKKQNPLR